MFTGLVQKVGRVRFIEPSEIGRRLTIEADGWPEGPSAGESIAVSGCCLTLFEPASSGRLSFDVVPETLRCTTLGGLTPGRSVNLERSARADSLLGGHIVQGHIDGVAEVRTIQSSDDDHRIRLATRRELIPLIPPKGSIAVEGVSLTVAAVGDDWFDIALIPTTLQQTTLGQLAVGDQCNIETDILARTVAHWLSAAGRPDA